MLSLIKVYVSGFIFVSVFVHQIASDGEASHRKREDGPSLVPRLHRVDAARHIPTCLGVSLTERVRHSGGCLSSCMYYVCPGAYSSSPPMRNRHTKTVYHARATERPTQKDCLTYRQQKDRRKKTVWRTGNRKTDTKRLSGILATERLAHKYCLTYGQQTDRHKKTVWRTGNRKTDTPRLSGVPATERPTKTIWPTGNRKSHTKTVWSTGNRKTDTQRLSGLLATESHTPRLSGVPATERPTHNDCLAYWQQKDTHQDYLACRQQTDRRPPDAVKPSLVLVISVSV